MLRRRCIGGIALRAQEALSNRVMVLGDDTIEPETGLGFSRRHKTKTLQFFLISKLLCGPSPKKSWGGTLSTTHYSSCGGVVRRWRCVFLVRSRNCCRWCQVQMEEELSLRTNLSESV